ncbi:hypothetical protein, partial [Klebsiella pneumoniae]|uniref:hypothetical protein n=1 Tax=Klebsiella pneumoniae TaxID=573 RepID=UPI0021D69165
DFPSSTENLRILSNSTLSSKALSLFIFNKHLTDGYCQLIAEQHKPSITQYRFTSKSSSLILQI